MRHTKPPHGQDDILGSIVEATSILLQNGSLEQTLRDADFLKSYDDKIKQLKESGHEDDASQMRQLIMELLDSMTRTSIGEMFHTIDAEGHQSVESDGFGRECHLLRKLSRTTAPRLIINHRQLELQNFCQVGSDDDEGIRIVSVDPERTISKREKREMREWSERIVNDYFWSWGSNDKGISTVLPTGYEDVFALNRLSFVLHKNRKDDIIGIIMIDPALVRELRKLRYADMRFDYKAFQQLLKENGRVPAEETEYDYAIYSEIALRNDPVLVQKESLIHTRFIHSNDYSTAGKVGSILEYAYDLVVMSVQAIAFNKGQISPSTAPRGILNISGANELIGSVGVNKFKQALWSYIKNPQNNHRMPVLQTPTGAVAQFISLQKGPGDAMFFDWMALLHTYLCALTGDDPNAIGLASNKGTMEGRTLVREGLDGATKRSNQLGRDTYLKFFVNVLNKHDIIPRITGNDKWKLEVTGLIANDARTKQELDSKSFSFSKSMNEIRAENDQELIDSEENPWADVPGFGNPYVSNAWMAKQQQEMMLEQQMQGAEGSFDEDDEDYEGEEDIDRQLDDEYKEEQPGKFDDFLQTSDNKPIQKSLRIEVEL